MNEEWKYVDGFRDLYEVSNLGRVRSYSTYPPRVLNNLRWDTSYSNMQDKIEHGNNHQLNKNYCPKKHEYNKRNTIVRNHRNTRECRACARAADTIRNGKGLKENFLEIANHHYKNIMLGYSDV